VTGRRQTDHATEKCVEQAESLATERLLPCVMLRPALDLPTPERWRAELAWVVRHTLCLKKTSPTFSTVT